MNRKHVLVLSILAVTAVYSSSAWGQSRKEIRLRAPRSPGWGPSARRDYRLNRYSTGLSDLNIGYRPADGSGALGSSIYSQQSMTRRRSTASVSTAHDPRRLLSSPAQTSRRVYTSPTLHIPTVSAPVRIPQGQVGIYLPSSAAAATSYHAVSAHTTRGKHPREIPEEILTSLVPKKPAKHHEQMSKGEEAFRKGSYAQALAHFETARQLSDDSPESLLSLGRTSFALADGSYAKTAEYLRKTLEIVPELPLVRVFPRSFYGNQQDYLRHAKDLENCVSANPEDPEAQFVLGYLRWRQGKPDESREALGIALANAQARGLTMGIQALLGGIEAAEQARLDEPPEMDWPIEYPCVGIRLALPKGFKSEPLRRMRQVLKSTRIVDGQAMSIVLAGQPAGEAVTARGIWDWAMGFWQSNPAISDLRLVEERDVLIADLPAVGRLFTYTSRGVDAAALGLCFIREVNRPGVAADSKPIRIGYAVLVTATRKQMTSMVGVINGVARSAELMDIRRPIDTPLELSDISVEDLGGVYSLRVPKGWTSGHDEASVVMGQIDYLLGGVTSPAVRVVTLDVPESMSAQACGESAIAHASKQQGFKARVLSQGPARLGNIEGYQFVVEKRTPLEAPPTAVGKAGESNFSEPFIEVGRMVSSPTSDGRKNFYVVILTGYDCGADQAETMMEKLASGFTLLRYKPAKEVQ